MEEKAEEGLFGLFVRAENVLEKARPRRSRGEEGIKSFGRNMAASTTRTKATEQTGTRIFHKWRFF